MFLVLFARYKAKAENYHLFKVVERKQDGTIMLCCAYCARLFSTVLSNIIEADSGVTMLTGSLENLNVLECP